MAVTFKGNTLFSSGNARIKENIEPVLEGLAGVMKALPYSIAIEGHTDDIPISSPQFPSNWELSTARASRVVRFLINNGVETENYLLPGTPTQNRKSPISMTLVILFQKTEQKIAE